MSNRIVTCVTLLGLAGLAACSSSPAYVPIPVEDARALNTQVSAFYAGTEELIGDAASRSAVVGTLPDGIRPQDFEIELVRSALMGCFNNNIVVTQVTVTAPRGAQAELGDNPAHPLTQRPAMDNVLACNPSEMISLESYLDVAPQRIRSFIVERLLTVDELRVNLKHVLQERLNLLEERVLDARGESARLRDVSRERYENTLSNDEVTSDQRLEAEADFEVIQQELDDIESLLDSIADELTELRRFRRQLVEDIAVHLSAMGTPGS